MAARGGARRGRGKRGGDEPEFPPEDVPNPGVRETTLAGTGYAPDRLCLTKLDLAGMDDMLPVRVPAVMEVIDNTYKAILVVNVPRDVLYADAVQWGAFDTSVPLNAMHARSVAFLLAATHNAAREAPGRIRVFAELVVRERLDLPYMVSDRTYNTSAAFHPVNVVGYRLWLVFGQGAPEPEVALRRCLFGVQAFMGLLPFEVVDVKMQVMTLFSEEERTRALESFARKKASKRRPRAEAPAKRRAAGADASDDEPMGDAASDDDAPAPDVDAPVDVSALRAIARTQPPSNIVARLGQRRVRHLGNLWLGVATLDTYLRDVVGSAHVLSRSATTEGLATRWGVAPALALPDAEAVSLSAASIDGAAAATNCWSFARSVATFYDEVRDHSACTEQLTAAEYGLDEDQVHFPFPNLVWELAPSGLNPIDFFNERMPWAAPRFEPAARRIVSDLGEQELLHTEPAAPAGPIAIGVAEPAQLRTQSAMTSMNRASVHDGSDRSAVAQAAALIRVARPVGDADPFGARRAAYRANVAHRFACIELGREYSLTPMVENGDTGCIRTEKLMAAVIPVYQKAAHTMEQALQALQKLTPPAGVDPAVWRYSETLRLHALYRTDVQAQLIGTIARGVGVPEVYQTSLARIRETGRISDGYQSDWCRLPQMSVEANAMVAMGNKLVSGINMMHGMIETMTYLTVAAVQSGDPEPRDMNHTLTYGQAGSSKSWNIERANEALLPGALIDRDWQSAASAYTHTNDSNKISFRDEANEILTNQTAEAQRRNGEQLARLKMQLTKGVFSFDRYHKDENARRSETLRVQAFRPMVETALANFINIGIGVDPALLDRYNVTAFMPFAMSNVMAVERAHDPLTKERRELWSHFCEMHKTEIAFKTMLVVLARAGVIASINTDVLKTMLAEALADVADYMPSLGESMRAAGRHEQFAIALIFHTAYYTVMRSEASELLTWTHVGAHHRVQPAHLDDIATIFGPHLYARADHGCWMLTQMVRTALPFSYYLVMLVIASMYGNFRRSFMAISYRRDGARLIDDAVMRRLASRDEGGRTIPEFVQELLRVETTLDNTVIQRAGNNAMPAFYESGGRRDPNWIAIDGKLETIAHRITPYIQRFYKVDESQVRTILMLISCKTALNVPIYAEHTVTTASVLPTALSFLRDASDKQSNAISYAPRQFIRIVKGNEPRLLISTGALMIPPQMMLVLMLTAAENKHTEPLQTVLPLELYGNAQLMHTWRVSRRPDHDPVFVNRNAMTHSSMRMERRSGSLLPASMANIVQTSGTDIVRAAFYRHMRELHQMPPYERVRAELIRVARETDDLATAARYEATASEFPPADDFELVFRAWADASPAAPGAAAARRAWAYRASPELAAEAANRNNIVHYPQTNALDQVTQTFLMAQLRGPPMAPVPRRNNHARPIAASLAAMQIDDMPLAAAPVANSYPAQRDFVRGVMLRLCAGEWFSYFRLYSASVEWRHLFMMLVDAVWGPHSAAARQLAADGTMPTEPAQLTARQFTCHSRLGPLDFSPCYLTMLAEWLHFVMVTRRIGIALVRDPTIRSVQHAYDSLIAVDVAPADLRIARLIDSVRGADPDMEIQPAIMSEYRRYLAAMDQLRPLRAARLAGLVKTAQDMAAAEGAADRMMTAASAQEAVNREIARLSMARARPVQNA